MWSRESTHLEKKTSLSTTSASKAATAVDVFDLLASMNWRFLGSSKNGQNPEKNCDASGCSVAFCATKLETFALDRGIEYSRPHLKPAIFDVASIPGYLT